MAAGTMAQQILASHTDATSVSPGEHVTVEPDWVLAHDLSTYPVKGRMAQLGYDRVAHPENVVIVFDHHVPSASEVISDHMNEVEAWVREQGIEHFHPAGSGICHNVLVEEGYSVPGALMLGADSHTTSHGAYGAYATGIGHTDCAEVLGSGELWLRVPETKKLVVENTLPEGTTAKDLGLAIMGRLTAKGAIYDAIEYHGEGVEALAMYERRTLSNLAVELGAVTGMVPPDDTTEAYLEGRALLDYEPVVPREDAEYAAEVHLDASEVVPLLATPSQVDNISTVESNAGVHVDQVFVGSCNNSSYEDLAAFAGLLAGEQVAPGTDLVVVPGSKQALLRLNEEGLSNDIVEAGGIISPPGCGPCFGAHGGILGEGDVCLGTMNRNFPGRMGPGEIYLGSPETAAATAIYGEITDPREVR
ncbi:aconitase/3-isopropylmalate dehydratase large subunit family protein [Salinirubellus salinus]|uniref:Aconitase/3-isopropylmalate dehydratase large subunit family protein n=1 Tax=Salinirubellus salinus TaxID=1364945 RepID=A0A9E7R2M4_9EURY|nr:aconitase/3-isopropylmalate dehydratase large subunit family protein [Salinirubellus salinus]UWM54492.1 aconitase/3-isopropylmalate dehydratase large subunit family protein [Salinirubellus salinus]